MREIVKDKGGDRAITSREEGQRVLGIHTRGIPSGCSPSISSSLPAQVSAEVWRWRREWKTAQCAHKARETLSPLLAPPFLCPLPEATEILEGLLPLCFWPLERVKIPARKLHLGQPLLRIPPSWMFEETRRTPRELSGTNDTSAPRRTTCTRLPALSIRPGPRGSDSYARGLHREAYTEILNLLFFFPSIPRFLSYSFDDFSFLTTRVETREIFLSFFNHDINIIRRVPVEIRIDDRISSS